MKKAGGVHLAKLLQTLRNNNVVEFHQSPAGELHIRFAGAPAAEAETKAVVADWAPEAGEDPAANAEAEEFTRGLTAELDNFKFRLERGAERRKARKERPPS